MDFDSHILNKLTVDKIYSYLNEEEADLLRLWVSGSFTLEEIGRIIGQKYHNEDIKPSVIRYYRNKILTKLRLKLSTNT